MLIGVCWCVLDESGGGLGLGGCGGGVSWTVVLAHTKEGIKTRERALIDFDAISGG